MYIKDVYENVCYIQHFPSKNSFKVSMGLQQGKKWNYIVVYTTDKSGLYKWPAPDADKYKQTSEKDKGKYYYVPTISCIKMCELNEITDEIIINAIKRKQAGWLNDNWVKQLPAYQNPENIDWILK